MYFFRELSNGYENTYKICQYSIMALFYTFISNKYFVLITDF